MRVIPHLCFGGNCEAAFRFYEQCLGGTIGTMLTYGASPMADQFPPEMHDRILHASLAIGEQELTGVDVPVAQYERPRGFYVLLNLDDPAAADRIFERLADGGAVGVPIQETFWAARFGVVVDRFGIPWEINCSQAPLST